MGRLERARERAAKLHDVDDDKPTAPALAPLRCPSCGAPVPLADGDVATCVYCKTAVPMPESYRALRAAAMADTADRAAATALYRSLSGEPPIWLHAWNLVSGLAGGSLFGVIALVFYINGALVFLLGFALELVLHALARPIHIDIVDRFGGFETYAGLAIAIAVLGVFPYWLTGYLETSAELRRKLRRDLAARPPERDGFPSTCRVCGAALEVPPGALGARCTYCGADNLVALPESVVHDVASSASTFHRSIVAAAQKASALRRDLRQRFWRSTRLTLVIAVAYGGCGAASVRLDSEQSLPSFGASIGPPRKMIADVKHSEVIPIDRLVLSPQFAPYTVALRRGEVLELSIPHDSCNDSHDAVAVRNTTTFPLLAHNTYAHWVQQTDGSFAARYTAPYTGLFQVTFSTAEKVRWRVGAHSSPGRPPPPPVTVTPVAATAPTSVLPEVQALAKRVNGKLPMTAPRRPDRVVLFADRRKKKVHFQYVEVYSRTTGTLLASYSTIQTEAPKVAALSPSARHVVSADERDIYVATLSADPIWSGAEYCPDPGTTTLAFLGERAFARGDSSGHIHVHSAKNGNELYQLTDAVPGGALPGAITSLTVSPDGTELIAGYRGGAMRFAVARSDAWTATVRR